MINTTLVLEVGHMKKNGFKPWDSFDLEIHTFDHDDECDNINDILSADYDGSNYARLRLHTTGMPFGFLIASFKRIQQNNKQYRWVLV